MLKFKSDPLPAYRKGINTICLEVTKETVEQFLLQKVRENFPEATILHLEGQPFFIHLKESPDAPSV